MINTKNLIFFLFLIVLGRIELFSQEMPNVIPPSPNAAALGKYGETPVGYYTGIPNVNIPLYTLRDKDIELPISLSYHAGGVKVNEIASWVGLGWTLNAGGVVSRNMRGLPDGKSYGILNPGYTGNFPSIDEISELSKDEIINYDDHLLVRFLEGREDSQPDAFSFNANGISGKFFLERKENGEVAVHMVPHQKIRIRPTIAQGTGISSWEITDTNGFVYVFNKGESQTSNSQTVDVMGNTTFGPLQTMNNSWYLTSITSKSTGAWIRFFYNTDSDISYELPISETRYILLASDNVNNPDMWARLRDSKTYVQQHLQQSILERIETSSGNTVEFTLGERTDLEGGKCIKGLNVINHQGNSISKHIFGHTYWSDRLFLKSVRKINNNSIPPYNFEYYGHDDYNAKLPSIPTNAQDYYGYYNGQNSNKTLIPYTSSVANEVETQRANSYDWANRIPSLEHTKFGVLKKIHYPTGGNTTFKFGLNQVGKYKGDFALNRSISLNISPNTIISSGFVPQEKYFEINSEQPLTLQMNAKNIPGNGIYPTNLACYFQIIRLDDSGNEVEIVASLTESNYNLSNIWEEDINYSSKFIPDKVGYVSLAKGKYKIVHRTYGEYEEKIRKWYEYLNGGNHEYFPCINNGDIPCIPLDTSTELDFSNSDVDDITSYSLTLTWQDIKKAEGDAYIGGLRVEEILDFDGNGNLVTKKTFDYVEDDGSSSGRAYNRPEHSSYVQHQHTGYQGGPTGNDPQSVFLRLHSDPQASLGVTNGSNVGYLQITKNTVDHVDNKDTYKTKYRFTGIKDNNSMSFIGYPYAYPDNKDWQKGKLKETLYYANNGKMVSRSVNNYNTYTISEIQIRGVKIATKTVYTGANSNNYWDIASVPNFVSVGYTELKNTVETSYFDIDSISTTTNYYYDNPKHLQLSKTITTDSQGKQLITENKYALDFPDGSPELGSKLLQGNHMHSQILEQTTKVFKNDGTEIITGKTRTTYSDETGHVLPKFIESFPDGTNAAPKLNYNYDEFGNLKEVLRDYDVPTSYLWGYNNSLPIAKIVGASYSEVESALGGATSIEDLQTMDEQALRDALDVLRNSLPDAMVTTYTYDPLIGMTSATDPNGRTTKYTYDDFGRLWHTKDHEGNIIQTYEYNYKQ